MLMLFVQGEIELNPYHGHWRYALNLILHQDNASETFSSFQVIQQKTKRAGRISMIGRLFRQDVYTFDNLYTPNF